MIRKVSVIFILILAKGRYDYRVDVLPIPACDSQLFDKANKRAKNKFLTEIACTSMGVCTNYNWNELQ